MPCIFVNKQARYCGGWVGGSHPAVLYFGRVVARFNDHMEVIRQVHKQCTRKVGSHLKISLFPVKQVHTYTAVYDSGARWVCWWERGRVRISRIPMYVRMRWAPLLVEEIIHNRMDTKLPVVPHGLHTNHTRKMRFAPSPHNHWLAPLSPSYVIGAT